MPTQGAASTEAAEDAPKEYKVKDGMHDLADRYSSSRTIANAVTGFVTGAVSGTLDGAVKAFPVTWEIIENVWQTEKIGHNLKIAATLVSPLGGALSAVASPIVQAFRDADSMADAGDDYQKPLSENGSNVHAAEKFSGENPSFSDGLIESLEEFGDEKLAPGEKPFDVPFFSLVLAPAAALVSTGVAATIGLAGGLTAGLLTTVKEAGGAVFGKNQSIGKRIGRLAVSPLHTVLLPASLVKEGVFESFPRGLKDGWNHGPFKPVIDTFKISTKVAAGAVKDAWER